MRRATPDARGVRGSDERCAWSWRGAGGRHVALRRGRLPPSNRVVRARAAGCCVEHAGTWTATSGERAPARSRARRDASARAVYADTNCKRVRGEVLVGPLSDPTSLTQQGVFYAFYFFSRHTATPRQERHARDVAQMKYLDETRAEHPLLPSLRTRNPNPKAKPNPACSMRWRPIGIVDLCTVTCERRVPTIRAVRGGALLSRPRRAQPGSAHSFRATTISPVMGAPASLRIGVSSIESSSKRPPG